MEKQEQSLHSQDWKLWHSVPREEFGFMGCDCISCMRTTLALLRMSITQNTDLTLFCMQHLLQRSSPACPLQSQRSPCVFLTVDESESVLPICNLNLKLSQNIPLNVVQRLKQSYWETLHDTISKECSFFSPRSTYNVRKVHVCQETVNI